MSLSGDGIGAAAAKDAWRGCHAQHSLLSALVTRHSSLLRRHPSLRCWRIVCTVSPAMKQIRTASAIVVLTLVTTSCSSMRNLRIEPPDYRIRDIRPRVALALPFSASTIDFDMAIDIDNPNAVGLRLDRVDFDLLVNGSHIVTGVSDQRIRIPANGIGTVQLRTRVGYDNIRSLFREVVDWVQGDRANYEIRGRAYYDTPVGRLNFPLTVYSSRR